MLKNCYESIYFEHENVILLNNNLFLFNLSRSFKITIQTESIGYHNLKTYPYILIKTKI